MDDNCHTFIFQLISQKLKGIVYVAETRLL